MYKLDSHSLGLVLSALEELHSDADPATLADRAVGAASRMISADLISFDFFSKDPVYEHTAWASDPMLLDPEFMKPFGKFLHQHPTVKYSIGNPNGEAMKITDVVSQTQFEQTDLFNHVYRGIGVNKQMGLGLMSEGDLTMTYAFTRFRRDFADREKAIIMAAAPHFVNAIRNGFAFRRISDALQSGGSGVVAIDVRGKLVFSSAYARVLLEKHFVGETLATDSLPVTLSAWLGAASLRTRTFDHDLPVEPYRTGASDGSRLTIRLLDNPSNGEELLLLEERRAAKPDDFRVFGLTPRECEVLYWITEGKTDPDIAMLLEINIRTVEKHVENIYRKIGVESRTAALRTALDVIH